MKFISALNALGPIPTALILIMLGGGFMLVFKFAGMSNDDIKTGHDIVIAGISFISGIAVASRSLKGDPTKPEEPAK
jgi:hypothetical protein